MTNSSEKIDLAASIEIPSAETRIRRGAIVAFYKSGYRATSIREIARLANLSVPALYHYYASKYDILLEVMQTVMENLIATTEGSVAIAENDAKAMLRAPVRAHVLFHVEHQMESFIGNTELRSLSARDLELTISARDRQQQVFDRAVLRGVEEGVFKTELPLEASRAIVTMCTAVATWYQADGGLSPSELADRYCELALAMVAYTATPDVSTPLRFTSKAMGPKDNGRNRKRRSE